MATFILVPFALGVFYLWLRGWWFVSLAVSLVWLIIGHEETTLQAAGMVGVFFAPFLIRLTWRHRARIAGGARQMQNAKPALRRG